MTYNTNTDESAQGLHDNIQLNRWKYSVKSGLAVSINSGTLGNSDTLSVASGDAYVDGSTKSLGSSKNVKIEASDPDNPRKDVVYLDSTGSLQVAKGTPEAKRPTGATRFDTYRPAPQDLSATTATVLAEVWVPAGNSSISSSDLKDRKVDADLYAQAVTAEEIFNDEEPNLDISERWYAPFSQGFEYHSLFDTINGLGTQTSGSGSVANSKDRVDLKTGSTDASHAQISSTHRLGLGAGLTWDKDRRMAAVIRTEDTQGKLGIFCGNVAEDDFTKEHFGFKYTGGNLEASVADGTTESTTTIQTTPATGTYLPVYAEFTGGTEVKFWINKNPNSNSPDATVSSNLPAGTGGDEIVLFSAHAENDSATARTFRVVEYWMVQMP